MCHFMAAMLTCASSLLVVDAKTPDIDRAKQPGQHYLEMAARPGISPMQKAAYAQLAKLPSEAFVGAIQFSAGVIEIEAYSNWEISSAPMGVLYRMGLGVLPVLTDALDDETPTKTISHQTGFRSSRTVGKIKTWNVNELVAILICHITGRDFLVGGDQSGGHLSHIREHPNLVPGFKKAVLSWYEQNGKKSLAERKIGDLNDADFSNRCAAIRWIGVRSEHSGREALSRRADTLLLRDHRDYLANAELVDCALALGQLGNRSEVDRVRRICEHVSSPQCKDSMPSFWELFDAFHGLALLGEKEEAVREFGIVYHAWCGSHPEAPENEQKRRQELLEKAKTWLR